MRHHHVKAWLVAAAVIGSVGLSAEGAKLALVRTPSSAPPQPNDLIQIRLRMSELTTPAAGMQAFIRFDDTRLEFVNGSYTPMPFELAVIAPIAANGSEIDLASGINAFTGQQPTTADADLAHLTFRVLTECGVGDVEFRPHDPPTRLTDDEGNSLLPLMLEDYTPQSDCPADIVQDGNVGVADLLELISNWGACPPRETCCPGDMNDDQTVGVADLLFVIGAWGPCP